MKFEKFEIDEAIQENLAAMGFVRTTDIQFKTIPPILNGEDVLAIAQTGTGKTAAFAIPVIHQVHTHKSSRRSDGIRCLVMVPTRELAKQIGQVFAKLTKNTRASSYAIYGGVEEDPQIAQLAGGVDILIATPGRMFALIRQGHISIQRVKTLVLDEADRMLDLGFMPDIEAIKRILTWRHQTLFFSATINRDIKRLAYSQVKSNAIRIQISPENFVSKNIKHYLARVEMDDKRHLLVNFFKANPTAKTIVFVRTQVRAERVLLHLQKNQVEVLALHGGMAQDLREKNLESFRHQTSGGLVATDVSARGIDLPGITHVINYDVPDIAENYVHRIGRTGRGFAKGDAITFCSSEEIEKMQAVEEFIQTEIPVQEIDKLFLTPEAHKPVETMDIAEMLAQEEARFFVDDKKTKRKK